ncbi:hypothetical protein EDD18DRAFT_1353090 [Armillaria luteobubalina]|uniref:Uncharacterized protein n=1 Tax=Armillaria luteobubalina TaxID=153913 RepID=A0AA39Q4Y9_9AGAR|nr:hypothetical protein EDD18DRAFT_1353090 [Armillaria luteobubalina]
MYTIWCCWMIWEQRWHVVLLPVFFLVSAIVSRTVEEYYGYVNAPKPVVILSIGFFLSFILATTLSCTLLILYRIVAVAGVRHGPEGQLGAFHHFIEVLVESSALYSVSLILDLAFIIHNDLRLYYFDTIVSIAKGVAPTLLVGRAAAGHTHPRDDSDKSTVSSIHFQTSSAHRMSSSQLEESIAYSSVLAMDIEAQPEQQVISIEQDTMMSTTSPAGIVA